METEKLLRSIGISSIVILVISIIFLFFYLYKSYLEIVNLRMSNELLKKQLADYNES